MSRRSYKTVNLPTHVVDWTDSTLNGSPLGIKSRDEFVRISVAVLGAALQPPSGGEMPGRQFSTSCAKSKRRVPA